jgi:phosphate/sulfate permease
MTTLPARISDTAKNPFVAITTVGIALIIGIVTIARRLHK